jgi:hypothetical protein
MRADYDSETFVNEDQQLNFGDKILIDMGLLLELQWK